MASRKRRWWPLAALSFFAILCGWVMLDLAVPVRGSLREFDSHAVARMETAMWRSYYGHHSVRLFRELAELLRTQYHLPFWRSQAGAYRAAKAAVVFQRGHNRGEYERALPDLEAFYRLIRAASGAPFDAGKAARLELDWWIVHRERAARDPGDLERALATLQAEIYGDPAARFEDHARARAEAMLLRDARAGAGAVSEADWTRIGELLDTSWTSLRVAVAHRGQ